MKLVVIMIVIICLSQYASGQKPVLEEGIVTFFYQKDSLIERYWLTKTVFQVNKKKYCLVPSIEDVIVKLDVTCNGADTILLYKEREPVSIYKVKQFRDTNQISENHYRPNYYLHRGGDVYAINNNSIAIIFHINAYMVKINQKPCERFSYGEQYDCPMGFESFYPMTIIVDVLKAKSLTKKEMKELKIKKMKNNDFEISFW